MLREERAARFTILPHVPIQLLSSLSVHVYSYRLVSCVQRFTRTRGRYFDVGVKIYH